MGHRGVFKKEAIIKVYSCRAKELGKHEAGLNLPERHFSKCFAIGEKSAPEQALLKSAIQIMTAARDTVGGIKIHFTAATKYQSFISILDILGTEKVAWWLIEGNIWVWYVPSTSSSAGIMPIYLCGTADIWKQQVAARLKNEQTIQSTQEMKDITGELWPSWLLFLALLVCTIAPSACFRHKR